jgi:hypothetical protein
MARHIYNARSRFGNEFTGSTRQFAKITMKSQLEQETRHRSEAMNAIRNWGMTAVTSVLALFYGAALLGWLKPLPDERVVARLEPIIFVIIGYYFGRLPSQQNEQTLNGEVSRQMQKAEASQHAKEQAQQARETLEEKIKNVRVTLASSAISLNSRNLSEKSGETNETSKVEPLRHSVAVALNILNS